MNTSSDGKLTTLGHLTLPWASLVAQLVKNPPAMQQTWVPSLGWEDPLKKGMATHSIVLPWESPWTEELAGYSPWATVHSLSSQRIGHD